MCLGLNLCVKEYLVGESMLMFVPRLKIVFFHAEI